MRQVRAAALGLGGLVAAGSAPAGAADTVKTVFVIAMENHDWTDGTDDQLLHNPDAPFLNSLVDGSSPISLQVAYARAYHNVLAPPDGAGRHIHPSEPNYIWAEAGGNFGVHNDADPYDPARHPVQTTDQHLSSLLQRAGIAWKSYQEDTDLQTTAGGRLANTPAAAAQWTVPLASFGGTFAGGRNEYNESDQYSYAAKHNPQVFFVDTNGGNDPMPANPLSSHYAPLQQLARDLTNNTVAPYSWITPDQYNDMHSALPGGFRPPWGAAVLRGEQAQIAQGDNFLARIVPLIMASRAYQDGGAIILWWDETEAGDDWSVTIPEIVISPLAHANVGGLPYASPVNLSHSSDLRTMQEIFGVGTAFLGDAANRPDLSDLFAPGAIPDGLGR